MATQSEINELQKDLDITTMAQVAEPISFPFAIKSGRVKYLVLAKGRELSMANYTSITCQGFDRMISGDKIDISVSDFICEVEEIIRKLKARK